MEISDVEKMQANKDVEGLIKALKDKDGDVREEAKSALIKIGVKNAKPLIQVLIDENAYVPPSDVIEILILSGWKPKNDIEKTYYYALHPYQEKDRVRAYYYGSNGNQEQGSKSEREILALGSDALLPLMRIINHESENYRNRCFAIKVLGEIRDNRSLGLLVNMLKGRAEERYIASLSLDKLDWKPKDNTENAWYLIAKMEFDRLPSLGSDAIEPLKEVLQKRYSFLYRDELGPNGLQYADHYYYSSLSNEEAYWEIIDALEQIFIQTGDIKAMEEVIKCIDRGYVSPTQPKIGYCSEFFFSVTLKAIRVLGEMGDPRALEPLDQALQSYNEEVQLEAVRALKKIRDARVVDCLIWALNNRGGYVRVAAAEALGEIGDEKAVGPLTQALEDKWIFDHVRKAAGEALEKIRAKKS